MTNKPALFLWFFFLGIEVSHGQSAGCNITQMDAAMSAQGFQFLNVQGYPCYRYYYNPTITSNWNTAQGQAASVGATLVTINDQGENDAVWQAAQAAGVFGGVWIGYTDQVTEGTWVWEDGSISTFTNWNSSEPSNNVDICSSTGEDAAVMQMNNGRWNDVYLAPVFPCLFPPSYTSIIKVNLCPQTMVNDASLCGGQSATLTASTTFGSPLYSYSWNSGETAASINVSPITTTNYIVTSTDRYGCTVSDTATVSVSNASSLTLNASGSISICDGGSVNLSVAGSYTSYSWSDGNISDTITVTQPGNYSLTTTDSGGCIHASDTISVSISNGLLIELDSVHHVSCSGLSDGFLEVSASGGVPGFNYIWNTIPAQNTQAISNLLAGTYIVTVTDQNLCEDTAQYIITSPLPLAIMVDSINSVSCQSINDGSVSISGVGGTPPYMYSIDGITFQSSGIYSSLSAGSYNIIVRDNAGCEYDTLDLTVADGSDIAATYSITQPTPGNSDGGVKINPGGGVEPYQFSINGNNYQSNSSFSHLAAGTYPIFITDANGCTFTDSVTISFQTNIAGLNEKMKMEVYPNPANEVITISINRCNSEKTSIKLFSVFGKSYFENEYTNAGNAITQVDVTHLPEGIYLVIIEAKQSKLFGKIIISR